MTTKAPGAICLLLLLASLASCQQGPLTGQDNYQTTQQSYQASIDNPEQVMQHLSATDRQRHMEQELTNQFFQRTVFADDLKQFGFEVGGGEYQDFHFSLPVDHTIHFTMKIYVLRENVYTQVWDIETEPACRLIMYQNNHQIVAEKDFYFETALSIQGKKGSTYLLRFYSPTTKLMIVSHSVFPDSSHFQDKVGSDKMQQYEHRLNGMENKLAYIVKVLKTTHRVEFEERALLTTKFASFSKFELAEMAILLLLTGLQVRMVARLFKSDSIV